MQLEAHAGIGWLLAQAGGSRKVRGAVLIAAVAPDIDAAAFLFGPVAYTTYHHVLAHNLLFSLLVSGVSAWICRESRLRAFLLTQAAFYTHFIGDLFLTVYPLAYLWPFSDRLLQYSGSLWLGHPINTALVYVGLAIMLGVAIVWKRSPVELLSPALDERIMNLFFRRRTLTCATCGAKANEKCAVCGKAACRRHARLVRGFDVKCTGCVEAK